MVGEQVEIDGFDYILLEDDLKILIWPNVQPKGTVVIRSDVVEIEKKCFFHCRLMTDVIFETGSRLKRIGPMAFCDTGLTTVTIPASVEFLDDQCFGLNTQLREILFEPDCNLRIMDRSAFCCTRLTSITIPRSVECIGETCFGLSGLRDITFEPGSQLQRIDNNAFSGTLLISGLEIPPECEFLKGRSLVNIPSIKISKQNPYFEIADSFVKKRNSKSRLIRYVGSEPEIFIGKDVEQIDSHCFSTCGWLRKL
jgi:hypothetical protein